MKKTNAHPGAGFSREAWSRNAGLYETIRTMPFNAELAAGVLSEARFRHYITQDAHYLVGFGRALALAAALVHDIHVLVSPGGTRDGQFLPCGIRWVVERLFAWLSRDRRLNIVYDRQPDLFAAHVWTAMISIISRRLVAHAQAQQAGQSRTAS